MSKTVLVPNAPWPVVVKQPTHKGKHIPKPANKERRKQIDANFERWLETERNRNAR